MTFEAVVIECDRGCAAVHVGFSGFKETFAGFERLNSRFFEVSFGCVVDIHGLAFNDQPAELYVVLFFDVIEDFFQRGSRNHQRFVFPVVAVMNHAECRVHGGVQDFCLLALGCDVGRAAWFVSGGDGCEKEERKNVMKAGGHGRGTTSAGSCIRRSFVFAKLPCVGDGIYQRVYRNSLELRRMWARSVRADCWGESCRV